MEAMNNSSMLAFDSPKEETSYIKVIGVGGGGGNAVNNMYAQGIKGVDFIICNTDQKALNSSPIPNKIVLGTLGAGNNPEVARTAALAHKDEIRCALENNTQMLFITAGMGGGTGTGAASVIAEIAKEIQVNDPVVPKILVVAVVTKPFSFEGKRRGSQAADGIEELRKHVDAIIVINNDKLRELGNLQLRQAFKEADNVLFTAVKGIAEIITSSDYVNVDFHDVNTVMADSGTALMGIGVGKGENRAMEAIQQATTSVLLDDSNIEGAKDVLLYFSYPPNKEITMDEITEVTEYLTSLTGHDCSDVIWGAGTDDTLSEELKVTLIATGFPSEKDGNSNHKAEPNVIHLDDKEKEKTTERTTTDNNTSATAHNEPSNNTTQHNATQRNETAQTHQGVFVHDRDEETDIVLIRKTATNDTPSAPQQEPVQAAPTRRVFSLDDDEPRHEPINRTNTATPQATFVPQTGMELKQHLHTITANETVAPAIEHIVMETETMVDTQVEEHFAPTPMPTDPFASFATQHNGVLSRAQRLQRIQRLNELLHNDPNAPQKVEAMTTAQLTNDPIYTAPHSSESDTGRMSLRPDGTIVRENTFLYNQPD